MMFSELACVGATYALPGETLTRLPRTKIRGSAPSPAMQERGYSEFSSKLLSRTAAEGGTKPPRVRAERGPRTGSGLGG